MPADRVDTDPACLTLGRAATEVAAGRLAASDLRASCLRRIADHDGELCAWAAVDSAGAQAMAPGPLAGVPIGVKDIIHVAGFPTRAGSRYYQARPERDAPAAERLRDAGAVILGKTACTEFATNDPAPTVSPWDAGRTPGGSSPGSAVAVATGMCFGTLDTQTAGDVLRPAAYNGIVGFKPTYGLVSREGTIGVAWSLDTLGVQARCAGDAELLFRHLRGTPAAPGTENGTPAGSGAEIGTPARSGAENGNGHQRTPKLGLLKDPLLEGSTEMLRQPSSVALELARAGAPVDEITAAEPLELAHAAHRVITFAECASLNADLYSRATAQIGPKFRELIELGMLTFAADYLRAQRVRARITRLLREQLSRFDAVLVPVAADVAPGRGTTGDSTLQIPWTFCGFPALSLPTGLSRDRLPLAVQLVAAPGSDTRLLRTARWCEAVLGVHIPPPR